MAVKGRIQGGLTQLFTAKSTELTVSLHLFIVLQAVISE